MHARIISERDFQTIHLKIITPEKAFLGSNDLISYELFSGDLGPVSVISKYSPASARTSSSAPLCPPAPPALGREFCFQKAMMALARAEIPPISGLRSLSG